MLESPPLFLGSLHAAVYSLEKHGEYVFQNSGWTFDARRHAVVRFLGASVPKFWVPAFSNWSNTGLILKSPEIGWGLHISGVKTCGYGAV